jgi:hypothetical protein
MLQVFYLDVTKLDLVLHAFAMAFKCFHVFCKCFRRMFQLFQLFLTYVASVSS